MGVATDTLVGMAVGIGLRIGSPVERVTNQTVTATMASRAAAMPPSMGRIEPLGRGSPSGEVWDGVGVELVAIGVSIIGFAPAVFRHGEFVFRP
jgi:hypothetical protein